MRTNRPVQKTKSRQQHISPRSRHEEPHAPPSSAISEASNSAVHQGLDNLYLTRAPLDANLLSELLGSLQDLPGIAPPTAHCDMDEMAAATVEYSQITNPTVLLGLQSLDELERQAAIHTDHRGSVVEDMDSQSIFHPQSVDSGAFATFDEDELSVALGQIDWSNFIPTSIDISQQQQQQQQDATAISSPAAFVAPAPTPAPTPIVDFAWERGQPMDLDDGMDAFNANIDDVADIDGADECEILRYQNGDMNGEQNEGGDIDDINYEDGDGEDDDDDDDDDDDHQASMELEELSMFSVFLSNMKAFEDFLANLSLNQLRQCAATVNSVLVRRESAMQGLISNRPPRAPRKQQQQQKQSQQTSQCSPADRPSFSPTAGGTMSTSGSDSTPLDAPIADPTSAQGCDSVQQPAAEPAATSEPRSPLAASVHGLPGSTVELLREWLSPSTADCVITALQAANLSLPIDSSASDIRHSAEGSALSATRAITDAKRTLDSATPRADTGDISGSMLTPASGKQAAPVSASSAESQLEKDSQGVPWLSFMYAQKGKPRRYRIRIDVDRAPLTNIPQSIQANNCVYPRANCSRSTYSGNRWNYETECNSLGWKLAFLNQETLSGRRGLLQTAVNNYRAMVSGRKSRRVTRMEKAEKLTAVGISNAGGSISTSGSTSLSAFATATATATATAIATTSIPASASATLPVLAAGNKRPASATATLASEALAGPLSKAKKKKTATDPVSAEDHDIHQLASPSQTAVDPVSSSAARPSSSAEGPSLLTRTASAPNISSAGPSGSVPSQTAKSLTVSVFVSSKFSSIRVSVNFGSIDSSQVDKQFQHQHAVFPRALIAPRSKYDLLSPGRWEFELTCNELAWKLAWLNKARLMGRRPLIQKCLDAYRAKFKVPPWSLLDCFSKDMDGSVDQRFYKYWNPRSGKHRFLNADDSGEEKATKGGRDALVGTQRVVAMESAGMEESSAARVRAILPRSANGSMQTAPIQPTSDPRSKEQQQQKQQENQQVTKTTAPTSTSTSTASSATTSTAVVPTQGAGARQQQPQQPRLKKQQQQTLNPVASGLPAQPLSLSPKLASIAAHSPVKRPTPPKLAPKPPVSDATAARSQQKTNVLNGSPAAKAGAFPAPARPKQEDLSSNAVLHMANTSAPRVTQQQRPNNMALQNGHIVANPGHSARPKAGSPMSSASNHGQQRNVPAVASQMRPAVSVARPPANAHASGSSAVKPANTAANGSNMASAAAASNRTPQPGPRPPPLSRPGPGPGPPMARPVPARQLSGQFQGKPHLQQQIQPQPQQARTPRTAQQQPPVASPQQNARLPLNSQHSASPKPQPHLQQKQKQQPEPPQIQSKSSLQSQQRAPPTPTSASVPGSSVPKALESAKSEKTAKAQAAASMLTDVLRRLAKKDPALATLTGVLEKKTTGGAAREALATADDDDSPLDAKLAEAEKLIIDMHKN